MGAGDGGEDGGDMGDVGDVGIPGCPGGLFGVLGVKDGIFGTGAADAVPGGLVWEGRKVGTGAADADPRGLVLEGLKVGTGGGGGGGGGGDAGIVVAVEAPGVDGGLLLVPADCSIGCTLAKPEGDKLVDVGPGDKFVPGEDVGDVVDCCCGATPAEPAGVTEGVNVLTVAGFDGFEEIG